MSSPASSTRSTNPRNPRRRQRASEDGMSLRQQPVRKRSRLNQDTFTAPANGKQRNGDVPGARLMNGHVASPTLNDTSQPVHLSTSPKGRSRIRTPRGIMKEDTAVTLTQNTKYTVKHFPSLPAELRSNKTAYHGTQTLSTGYTLALTRDQAWIWNYTASTLSPSAQSLRLPYPAKMEDSIPLGAFVTWGSGNDTGLVVVNATSGRISFWESIENADTLSLFEQRKNGIEGSCGRLMYGETVTDLQDVESAGFILSFSTGRVAQLLVRDAQSQPSISVNFLRSSNSASGTGFLGSLKNVFGSSGSLRSVVATHSRPSGLRGQTEVIVASEEATFQLWQLNLSGQAVLHKEIETRPSIEKAIVAANAAELRGQKQGLKLMDFTIIPDNLDSLHLLLLVSVGVGGDQEFALVTTHMNDDEILVTRQVIPLSSYNAPLIPKSPWKPKLCLPNPGTDAFVVFPDAIVLVSLEYDQNSDLLDPLQDAIYFRDKQEYVTCGAVSETHGPKHKDPSILVFLQNFGIMRITAMRAATAAEDDGRESSAKSKMEQAVFFGDQKSNPLNLVHKLATNVTLDEVESAALLISEEILATTSPCLRALAPSMELNLEQRARNLESLASYLQRFYPDISRETRWKLRFDAEKMATARRIWVTCDRRKRKEKRDLRLLEEIIVSINEDMKTPMDPHGGEKDETRHFFLKDIGMMWIVIAWAYKQVQYFKDGEQVRDNDHYLELLSEAGDLVIGGLNAAFEFRSSNAALYGLDNEPIREGLLSHGYEGLPEFWTSHPAIWAYFPRHLDLLKGTIEQQSQGATSVVDVPMNVQKITTDMVNITDLFCKMGEEGIRHWLAGSEEMQAKGKKHQYGYKNERKRLLVALPTTFVDLANRAMELAEKYSDMIALVDIIREQSSTLTLMEEQTADPEVKANANKEIMELEQKVRQCCKKHGSSFTNVFYTSQIENGQLDGLLDQAISYPTEVTEFFRSNPETRKIGWINEALFEKDYFGAAQDLINVAVTYEADLWNRKVEIAIAKLALAAAPRNDVEKEDFSTAVDAQKEEAQIIRIQETIYDHFRPELYNAVDDEGALELAMQSFGNDAALRTPRQRELLEHAMVKLVTNKAMAPDQLVDLLTLMDSRPCELAAYGIDGKEPLLALEVLKYAGMEPDRVDLMLRIVWRRCFLRDKWYNINDTAGRSDQETLDILESTTLFKTIYEGFARGIWDDATSQVRILSPKDVDGAGTTAEEQMVRFSAMDLCEPIAAEMRIDNDELRRLMSECRLEHWFEVVREAAELRWRTEAEAKETLAQTLGTTTREIYDEDEGLERGEEAEQAAKMAKVPGSWQDAESMGLDIFR